MNVLIILFLGIILYYYWKWSLTLSKLVLNAVEKRQQQVMHVYQSEDVKRLLFESTRICFESLVLLGTVDLSTPFLSGNQYGCKIYAASAILPTPRHIQLACSLWTLGDKEARLLTEETNIFLDKSIGESKGKRKSSSTGNGGLLGFLGNKGKMSTTSIVSNVDPNDFLNVTFLLRSSNRLTTKIPQVEVESVDHPCNLCAHSNSVRFILNMNKILEMLRSTGLIDISRWSLLYLYKFYPLDLPISH